MMKKSTTRSTRRSPAASAAPVSVVLPASLRARVASEARRRGLKLSPAIRVLLGERFQALDENEQLTRAEEWQRAQAWATWEKIKAGPERETSWPEVEALFDETLQKMDEPSHPKRRRA